MRNTMQTVPRLVTGLVLFMSADIVSTASMAFEWAGIFKLPEASYMWTAQKVDGSYADASMKLAAIPVAGATEATLHGAEADGVASLAMSCTDTQHAGVITPANGTCYKLIFNQDLWQSLFKIDASSVSAVALFTEHVPTEFEATAHYLKDKSGEDIEPIAELPESQDATTEGKPWGDVIGASIIVNLITLVGVILVVPAVLRAAKAHYDAFQGILYGFSAGCIIAAAVFLLMFESTHLIGTGWKEEVAVLWRWGTMILAGFVLPSIVDFISAVISNKIAKPAEEEGDELKQNQDMTGKVRIIAGVLVGDFFHNLCDGFFIGAAFQGCGSSFGWTVTLSTVLHELPQELADYFILTSSDVGMKPVLALVLNFMSGLSVVLGAIIILASEPANSDVGLLLAFGAGVYLHIGAVECMPKIYENKLSAGLRGACVMAFILGTVLIGLILLDHEHCVPEGAEGGHGGGHHL